MPNEVKETVQYECEAESVEDLVKIFGKQLWSHSGRRMVQRARKDLSWMTWLLPPWLFESILAYGMATAVRIIITEVMTGNLEFMVDRKDGGQVEAKADGEVSR